ncbi:MAG: citrate synthase [Bacteroidetes bacterium]|nr:citrate synthase [Bacteroidota bacterium]
MVKKAQLTYDDKSLDLPLITGSENEQAIDISKLRSSTGLITMDNGFGNTGACSSSITFLDGEKGILRYRGYNIQDLCEHASFMEVSFLLLYGELPSVKQLEQFSHDITKHTMLHESLRKLYDAYPRDAHPMALMSAIACSLSTFYQDSSDPLNPDHIKVTIFRMLAKIPTIAAYAFKKSIGQPMIYPNNSLSYCANFLNMMFSVPAEPYEVDPDIEKALDQLFILHADHEQNCSTSTVRMVGSSHANLFAAISAGICALWGPLHGGANQEVLQMLKHIHEDGNDVKKYIDKAKDKTSNFRLMGFGHRVYKNFDPRAQIIKKTCDRVLSKLNINDPLLDIAHQLEEAALKDPYFIEKKLYPNVDFYSGIIYKAIGFPVEMFTVLFAIGRLPGWIAQWKEMMESKETRIGRPRQIYTGPNERKFLPMHKRQA